MDETGEDLESGLRALMASYQEGRLDAFERLYAALAPGLQRYLFSLVRDEARAADLVQETFLQIHRSRHTYRSPLPVRPWAFAIARHVHRMDARTRRRKSGREVPADEVLLPATPSPADGIGERDRLRRALAALPEGRRRALLLHHLGGLSFREVGAALGIGEGAARLRASRGVAVLRTLLAPRTGGGGRGSR